MSIVLQNITKVDRFNNLETGQTYNVWKGTRKGYGTDYYFYYYRSSRVYISVKDVYDSKKYERVEPF